MEERDFRVTSYGVASTLFLLGVLLKQFYLFSSGGFQLGDFCFMGSFVFLVVFYNKFRIPITGNDILFIGFVGCIIIINLIYIFIYGTNYPGEFRFHMSIIYYIYNLFIILTIRQFSNDKEFLTKLRRVLQLGLLIQFGVAVAGVGRYGSMRYMGTFNDPNQFSFFVFSSFLLIFVISTITKDGHPIIWYVIAFYLIIQSVSTGMLLGMLVLLISFIFIKLLELSRKSAILFVVTASVLLFFVILLYLGVVKVPESIEKITIVQRALTKILSFGIGTDGVGSGGFRNLMIDRCWDRLWDYPSKILYGAGEGYFNRFPSARYTNNEIHSSILGPLFYYGIFPCSIWFIWTVKQFKSLKRDLWCVYLALIVESITLVNNRQPFFWMLFVLAGSFLAKDKGAFENGNNPKKELAF